MRRALTPLLTCTALLAAGCGGGDPVAADRPRPPVKAPAADPALRAMLPEAVRQAGTLDVGTTLPNVPYLLTDSANTITGGITPDVGRAVAAKLGLKYSIRNVAWEALLPGVAGGRYMVADDGISDTAERQKVGIFIDYTQSSSVLVTAKANGGAKSQDAACGNGIATIRGTTDVDTAKKISADCAAKGRPPVRVTQYPTAQDADLALRSGREKFEINVAETAEYAIRKGSPIAIVARGYMPAYVGMYVGLKQTELAKALLGALTALKKDGTLDTILGGYGSKPITPGINLATAKGGAA
ncbi:MULTISPECIES: transporter substrate-binding domain-containing protein [Actinomadura]|uniref:Transporter substrate-binding domain-containing protein n=1 Tax=Actinomadura litoris TaxID=2678616 RepID=A0A7K1L376_9ACTN|nr:MULTISPECIES: transporter substrate-binding domain-containing protein [Actinomadura]MBT2213443.1 transporter substrate-binding domain-containing protein [Actinomadura sp. NEAU-AAG7]MUN38880.1 transporter substrate-binding domain-containing protein [Actinomadura litoris]